MSYKNLNNKYKKHNSFYSIKNIIDNDLSNLILRIKKIYSIEDSTNKFSPHEKEILDKAIEDIKCQESKTDNVSNNFTLTNHVIDEMSTFEDQDVLKYLIHRYRYEMFPKQKIVDNFPPYLQIEPSSICNYRCVFCFETDKSFTNKKNGFMGEMKVDLFKQVIDQAQGNIEFLSLASRGEPLVSKNIIEMLAYTRDKFLNLKINTNASLLNEEKTHSILQSGIKTVVFSADAADEKLYSKLRVNGSLKKVLNNIENFNKIKDNHYKDSKIITRVSGVKYSDDQNFEDMEKLWGNLVRQVAFVNYNPWENSYEKEANSITEPCSDLWRRMFVWWDGKVNPCDVDYKSNLSVGNFQDTEISKIWLGKSYNDLRKTHLNKLRKNLSPCKSCTVV